MVLWHDFTADQSVHVPGDRIRSTSIYVFMNVLYLDCVFRKTYGSGHCRNVYIEPLSCAWIIGWNKYARVLPSPDHTNNFYRLNRGGHNLLQGFSVQVITCIMERGYNKTNLGNHRRLRPKFPPGILFMGECFF